MKNRTSNPTGKNGKPIIVAPLTFDEAVRKMLATPPPPQPEAKAAKPTKTATKKAYKR